MHIEIDSETTSLIYIDASSTCSPQMCWRHKSDWTFQLSPQRRSLGTTRWDPLQEASMEKSAMFDFIHNSLHFVNISRESPQLLFQTVELSVQVSECIRQRLNPTVLRQKSIVVINQHVLDLSKNRKLPVVQNLCQIWARLSIGVPPRCLFCCPFLSSTKCDETRQDYKPQHPLKKKWQKYIPLKA